jgi:branched-chain amino acid transport system substrate-binding protein
LSVASGKFTYDKNHNPITGAIVIAMKDGKQTFKEKINL